MKEIKRRVRLGKSTAHRLCVREGTVAVVILHSHDRRDLAKSVSIGRVVYANNLYLNKSEDKIL